MICSLERVADQGNRKHISGSSCVVVDCLDCQLRRGRRILQILTSVHHPQIYRPKHALASRETRVEEYEEELEELGMECGWNPSSLERNN